MKENYRAWNINIDDFPREKSFGEQLKFLINFAILAPSGHNSQPWNFSLKEDEILAWKNEERALAQSDPLERQLSVSIGCALENLVVAADYYGLKSEIFYFPDPDKMNLIARVIFTQVRDGDGGKAHLIFSIPQRNCNRNKYKFDLPSQDFLEQIQNFSNDWFNVTVVTDKVKKDKIADIVGSAQIEAMDDDKFREELSHYIKSSFTKEKIGMPGFTLGIPAPISIVASRLIRKINLSRKAKKKDQTLLKKFTPAFVILSIAKDEKIYWIKAGQLFERIWLTAEQKDLKCAPLAAVVQVDNYCKELQRILEINFRPLVFFRLGYCNKISRHSPRLTIAEVLHL